MGVNFSLISTSAQIRPGLDLLSSVTQPQANTLSVTWSPLPSIHNGLEEHYFYILEIRKSTDDWSDRNFTQTFQHQAGVTEYSEDISIRLDLDITYIVRLVGKRVHKYHEERVIVSTEHAIDITSTGLIMF